MKHPTIRAILLAAGLGTRLRPITLQTPKCLVSVGGQPLLERWLRQLEKAGCKEAIINTHYLAKQVENFLQDRPPSNMIIKTSYETKLLGTAGTLLANKSFFEDGTGLLIHADNAMEDDLGTFLTAHKARHSDCLLTMLTFNTDNPRSCGIVNCNSNGVIDAFYEKVDNPPGNRANGALYAFDQLFLDYLSSIDPEPSDFSTEVLPTMLGRMQACHTKGHYLDIGTPAALAKAQTVIAPIQ